MKKRTKISLVLSSAAAILLAGSIMAGGTYALFTSESKTNIVVSSGKVDVSAEISDLHTYTGKDLTGVVSDDASKIKLSTDYTLSEGQFMNGGTASYDAVSNTLTLDKMTPGDKVTFNIKLANNESNVAAKYRTVISCEEDDGLLSGLEFTIDGIKFDGLNNKSTWAVLSSDFSKTLNCVVNLPSNAGNEYQDKLCKVSYKIEAVQGNAETKDTPANTIEIDNAAQLGCFRDKVNKMTTEQQKAAFNGYTIKLTDNIDLNGKEWIPIRWNEKVGSSEVGSDFVTTFDGDYHTISNFKVNKLKQKYAGLFSIGNNATFKNLKINNAEINAANGVGAIVGYGYRVKIQGCEVTGSTLTASFWEDPEEVSNENPNGWNDADKVGALAGRLDDGYVEITDCTSSGNTIEGYRDVGGLAGFVGGSGCKVESNTIKKNTIKNNRKHNYKNYATGTDNYETYNVRAAVGQVSGFTVGENTIGTDGDANIFSIINAD